jgi:hypothetical protein
MQQNSAEFATIYTKLVGKKSFVYHPVGALNLLCSGIIINLQEMAIQHAAQRCGVGGSLDA